ncbi:MAG: DUF1570 domain-containing protein [Planctomycetota bacterium]
MRHVLLLTALLLLAVGLRLAGPPAAAEAAPPRSNSSEVETALRHAEGAMDRGAFDEAWRTLWYVISRDPLQPDAARMLRQLDDEARFSIPVDGQALEQTLGRLGTSFRVSQTRHFIILSDCDPEWTASREALLQRTYHQMHRFADRLGVDAYPPRQKLMCVLINEHDAYETFARTHDRVHAHWVAGYYTALENRVVFYNDATGPSFQLASEQIASYARQADEARAEAREARRERRDAYADQLSDRAHQLEAHVISERRRLEAHATATSASKTIHEAAHLVAFNCGIQLRTRRYPFWITEGLATCFETSDPRRPFGPDRIDQDRERGFVRLLEDGRPMPLDRFVALTEVPDKDAELAESMYPQAYALFRHIARFHEDELRAMLQEIGSTRPASDIDFLAMFERHFGDAGRFERRWLLRERR